MANRIVGNVYIIDSQMGAGAALIIGSPAWPKNAFIQAIGFWASSTASVWEMVFASNTAACCWKLAPETSPTPSAGTFVSMNLGGVSFDELRCKTLTTGTGFIYFG